MARTVGLIAALVATAILPGCVTVTPLAPVVQLNGRSCSVAPALGADRGVALPFDKQINVEVGDGAACLQAADGSRSTYALFALPAVAEAYVVSVVSVPRGDTLLSPRLAILDANGTVTRERPRDVFMFHGATLQAGMRVYPGDRYLVVMSDPATVGKRVSQIIASTQSTMVPMGSGMFVMNTGSERGHSAVFAHNGELSVRAQPLPKVN